MADGGERPCTKFDGDNPVLIYLPETAFDPERFISDVNEALEKVSKSGRMHFRRN